MPELMISIPLAKLKPSPTNPRKHFDDSKTAELAASIGKVGVLEPIIVRQWKKTDSYEIVCGERRFRAAGLARVEDVPAIVREYSDDDVLEIQITENSQRENVHPLDEADGFLALVDRGRSPQSIADKIGRPLKHVIERLQLLRLSPKCRKALDADQITLGVAMLLARIPHAKLQDEALERVGADERRGDACLTTKAASAEIQERFMLKLVDAPFDRADPNLVKAAGACTVCPKRTGNQTELFDDVKSPDLCTDGVCYRQKLDAQFKQVAASKQEDGVKVLSASAAKKTFNPHGHGLNHSAGYESLHGERWDSAAGRHVKVKAIVGKDAEITLAQDPKTGEIHQLVSRKLVEAALSKAHRETKKATKVKAKKATPKELAKRKADAEKAQAKEQINEALVDTLVTVAEGAAPPGVYREALRYLAKHLTDSGVYEGLTRLCRRRELGGESGDVRGKPGAWAKQLKAFDAAIAKADSDWLWGVIIEMMAWEAFERDYGPKTGSVDPLLKAFGVDRKKVEKEVTTALAAAKSAAAEDAPAPKKKAATKKATAKKTVTKKAPKRKAKR